MLKVLNIFEAPLLKYECATATIKFLFTSKVHAVASSCFGHPCITLKKMFHESFVSKLYTAHM